MGVVRWRFDDPVDSTFAIFEINPNAGGSPTRSRTITNMNTVVPGGRDITYEGAQDPLTYTFSGLILTQSMLDLFILWFGKKHTVQLTDDVGRQFPIMMTKFTPKRVRSRNFNKYTYDATVTVVDV